VLAQLAARGADLLAKTDNRYTRRIVGICGVLLLPGAFGLWWFSEFLRRLDPSGLALWNFGRTGCFLIATALVVVTATKWRVKGLLLLVLVDVGLMSYGIYPRGHASNLFPQIPATRELAGSPPRTYAFDGTFFPNSGMVYHVQDVRGYDVITPRRLFRFMQTIDPNLGNAYSSFINIDPNSIHANTLMRRVIGAELERQGPALINYLKSNDYWSVGVTQITRPELFQILRIQYIFGSLQPSGYSPVNTSLAPQAFARPVERFAVFDSWVEEKEEAVIGRMSKVDLDRVVVVEGPSAAGPAQPPAGGVRKARLLFRNDDSSGYEVEATGDSILVEFERFSAGWRAFLDDKEVEVFPADYLFRAVHIPPGKHQVRFEYAPAAFRRGLAISLLGLVVAVGVGLAFHRAKKL